MVRHKKAAGGRPEERPQRDGFLFDRTPLRQRALAHQFDHRHQRGRGGPGNGRPYLVPDHDGAILHDQCLVCNVPCLCPWARRAQYQSSSSGGRQPSAARVHQGVRSANSPVTGASRPGGWVACFCSPAFPGALMVSAMVPADVVNAIGPHDAQNFEIGQRDLMACADAPAHQSVVCRIKPSGDQFWHSQLAMGCWGCPDP